jgi:hypothetical protein
MKMKKLRENRALKQYQTNVFFKKKKQSKISTCSRSIQKQSNQTNEIEVKQYKYMIN